MVAIENIGRSTPRQDEASKVTGANPVHRGPVPSRNALGALLAGSDIAVSGHSRTISLCDGLAQWGK